MNHHRKRIKWNNEEVDNLILSKRFNIKRIGNCSSIKDLVDFECAVCQHKWATRVYTLKMCKRYGCPKCANIIRLNNEIIDDRIKYRNIIRIGNYENARKSIEWGCLTCNHKWNSSADNILRGKGCANCDNQLQITNDYVDEKLKINNPLVTRIGSIISSKCKCDFKCKKCKTVWSAIPNNVYRNKNPSGCPKCLYKRENFIYDFLKENLPNEFLNYHYNFFYLKKKFIIDFHLKINDKIVFIEYNGEQHYKPFRFKKETEKFEAIFKKQVERDNLLRIACLNSNIILIELPYTLTNAEIIKKILELPANIDSYVKN